MRMFLGGEWVDRPRSVDVKNPYDGSVIETVPEGRPGDVSQALETLVDGARTMRDHSAWDRGELLDRAVSLMRERAEDLGRTISLEEGKTLREARVEVGRATETVRLSAEEARRLVGEMVPLDGTPNGVGKMGFTLRVPCGIVAAITPFNFPLNLVAHKVAPAIAGGNAVLLKPASDTPLTALRFTEILLDAGLPPQAIACITGAGKAIGQAISEDPRIRKISFTGSYEVGRAICQAAGVKKVTMELGSNCPVIIMDDADLELASKAICAAGYANAGQVCISAQRILTLDRISGDFLDALKPQVESLKTGDPLSDDTSMGPMIRESDVERVESWIREAIDEGATPVIAGERRGSLLTPTLLADVNPKSKVSCEELFGPAVAVTRCNDLGEAIRLANDTQYGLSAAIFTRDLHRALSFARDVDAGSLHINWSSQWRTDAMPYGGLKHSGMGKEGPRYTIRDMTEEKMVVLHLDQMN